MHVTLTGSELENNLTNYKKCSLASTNATNLKNKAGKIMSGILCNSTAAVKHVKFYDKATAPTVGTDVPILTIGIPANSSVPLFIPYGIHFDLGISFAITGLCTDADTTAVAANDVIVNLQYA